MNEGPAVEPRTLSAAYELHARHGRTYYLATLLLPRWKRRHVHALYRFTRYADEIVDDLDWVCCVVPTRGVLTPLMSPDQIATASSSKANATRRSAGSSAASS